MTVFIFALILHSTITVAGIGVIHFNPGWSKRLIDRYHALLDRWLS